MPDFSIRIYRPADEADVIRLWQECGLVVSWNNPAADIERKRADSPDLFFVGLLERELIASCMAGYDGHRGWIYYLAVKTAHRGKGFAAKLVAQAEAALAAAGCPKIDLMVRNTNDSVIEFYRRIGYKPDPVVVLSKRLIEDEKHEYH